MGGSKHIWGKERVIHWLMQAQRAGGEITPSVALITNGLLGEVLDREGFPVAVLGARHERIPNAAYASLVAFLNANRDIVVHTHGYKANVLGRVAKARGLPMRGLVSTSHGFDDYSKMLAVYNAVDRYSAFLSDVTTVTDPRMALKFPGTTKPRFIANGIPDQTPPTEAERIAGRARFGLHEGQFAVGMLHRLIPQKGVDEYLDAVRFAARWDRKDIVWMIAGDGALREAVESSAKELPQIRYVGYVDPPDDYLAALDAFIQPSRSEGLSLALLQGMRAGKTIVATRVGATEQVVDDGTEALVIEPRDSAALATAVVRIADDRPYALRLGIAARVRFEREFRIERQHEAFLAVYRDAITRHGGTP